MSFMDDDKTTPPSSVTITPKRFLYSHSDEEQPQQYRYFISQMNQTKDNMFAMAGGTGSEASGICTTTHGVTCVLSSYDRDTSEAFSQQQTTFTTLFHLYSPPKNIPVTRSDWEKACAVFLALNLDATPFFESQNQEDADVFSLVFQRTAIFYRVPVSVILHLMPSRVNILKHFELLVFQRGAARTAAATRNATASGIADPLQSPSKAPALQTITTHRIASASSLCNSVKAYGSTAPPTRAVPQNTTALSTTEARVTSRCDRLSETSHATTVSPVAHKQDKQVSREKDSQGSWKKRSLSSQSPMQQNARKKPRVAPSSSGHTPETNAACRMKFFSLIGISIETRKKAMTELAWKEWNMEFDHHAVMLMQQDKSDAFNWFQVNFPKEWEDSCHKCKKTEHRLCTLADYAKLYHCVTRFKDNRSNIHWKKISQDLFNGARSVRQCRSMFSTIVEPAIKVAQTKSWSAENDSILSGISAEDCLGRGWSIEFPGRSRRMTLGRAIILHSQNFKETSPGRTCSQSHGNDSKAANGSSSDSKEAGNKETLGGVEKCLEDAEVSNASTCFIESSASKTAVDLQAPSSTPKASSNTLLKEIFNHEAANRENYFSESTTGSEILLENAIELVEKGIVDLSKESALTVIDPNAAPQDELKELFEHKIQPESSIAYNLEEYTACDLDDTDSDSEVIVI